MIGSRRWRSISFCTKLVGTDRRAKPSVITSGLTSFSQALCWGVRFGAAGSLLAPADEEVSPFSSASTVFHTATNGASGSALNYGYPLEPVQGTRIERRRTVHIVIHSLSIGTVAAALLSTGKYAAGVGSSQLVRTRGSRPVRLPRFVVCRRPSGRTALPEANSFMRIRQPFCNIPRGQVFGNARLVTAVTDGVPPWVAVVWFDLGKSRQYPRTVARMWRHGCDPELHPETAPVSERDEELTTGIASSPVRLMWLPDATRSDSRGQGQADLSTQQPAPCAGAWVSATDADTGRPGDRCQPAR